MSVFAVLALALQLLNWLLSSLAAGPPSWRMVAQLLLMEQRFVVAMKMAQFQTGLVVKKQIPYPLLQAHLLA